MIAHIPGAIWFENLRTVDDLVYNSYKDTEKPTDMLKIGMERKEIISEAFDLSFVPLTHLYSTIIAYRKPENQNDIWYLEAQTFIDDFRLCHILVEEELQSDDVFVSYVSQEVNAFVKTFSVSSNMKVDKFRLRIPQTLVSYKLFKGTKRHRNDEEHLVESFPNFKYD